MSYLAAIPTVTAKSRRDQAWAKRSPPRCWRHAPKTVRMRPNSYRSKTNTRRLCADADCSLVDLAKREAVCARRVHRNSGRSRRSRSPASNGRQTTTRSRISAAGPARSARPADRGRPLLADHRTASYDPVVRQIVAPSNELALTARGSWRSSRWLGRCLHRCVRCQVSLRVLASDHSHPQRRHDDNPATERDATWQPIDNTPMHPEYPCAHCIVSGAVAAVIEAALGTADIPEVAMTSSTAPGVTHRLDQHSRPSTMRFRMPASGPVFTTDSRSLSDKTWDARSGRML